MSLEDRLSALEAVVHQQGSTLSTLRVENALLTSATGAQQATIDSHERIIAHLATTLVPEGFWIDRDGRGKDWEWSLGKYRPARLQGQVGAPLTLFSLPAELLHLIVSFGDRADLLALCLVNLRLLAIAADILYGEITAEPVTCDRLFLYRDPARRSPRLDRFLSLRNIRLLVLVDPIRRPGRHRSQTINPYRDPHLGPTPHRSVPFEAQTQAKRLVNVSMARFDATHSRGLPVPRLILRTDISTLGALKQYAHLLRILNPLSFQIEGPLQPAPAVASGLNAPFVYQLPGGGSVSTTINVNVNVNVTLHVGGVQVPSQPAAGPSQPGADASLPPTPRMIQLDRTSRLDFLYAWHKLEEIIFIGESVIPLPEVRACLERASSKPGRIEYELVATRASDPDVDTHDTFGPRELEDKLKDVGKKATDGEKVVDSYLRAVWVEEARQRRKSKVELTDGEVIELSD